MALISTDYRDYLTPEGPSGRPPGERVRGYALKALARIVSYMLVALGITCIGWGAGFDSAWVLAVLFAYPLTETLDWLFERVRERGYRGRAAT